MIGKYLVIGALLSGIIALFLPFFTVKRTAPGGEQAHYSFSAIQVMQGVEGVKAAVEEQAPEREGGEAVSKGVEEQAPEQEDGEAAASKGVEEQLGDLETLVMIPFIPTAVFLLITLVGIKRFGRGLGMLSLLVGLVALTGWASLNAGMAKAGDGGQAAFEIGFTMLMVGSVLGTLGGIMGLVQPQPKST